MNTIFEEKQKKLLQNLKKLALHHNRDYYFSIIPIVEFATPDQEDVLDIYQSALDEDSMHLLQSRDAFITVERINSLI